MKKFTLRTIAAAVMLSAAVPSFPSETPAKPTVGLIDQSEYTRLVSGKDGKVVVVNMWATWCEPCREEFPELVRFHREMGPLGVEMISLSLDLTSDIDTRVIPFLREHGASFAAYVKKPGGDDAFINSIDRDWSGALPATFIYDTNGKLTRSILTTTSFEELKGFVEPLLKKD